ncbi:MAG: c-type cytochrome [Deltaproteobacteria bacterium]|nr:c-type cytochrome [Deltaproteobacteria bacterium]
MKRFLPALLLAACSDPPTTPPSTTPPPTWGVPVSGGTMHITTDGKFAVAADPDRDRIVSVDLASGEVVADVPLLANDEPGRVIEDAAGRVHIALRRGGGVIAMNPATGEILSRRATCAEPRGLAFDATADSIHVACSGGELVTLPAGGGDPTRVLRLDRDLRDVLVVGDRLYVTRFRSAELLRLDATGTVISRAVSPTTKRIDFNSFDETTGTNEVDAKPAIAWRALALEDSSVLILHQRQINKQLGTSNVDVGGYGGGGGGCGDQSGPVESAVTIHGQTGSPRAVQPAFFGALPVDIAVNKAGDRFAVVLAGSQTVRTIRASFLPGEDHDQCPQDFEQHDDAPRINDNLGTPTSVQFTPDGAVAIFYPEVPAIAIHPTAGTARIIKLPGDFGYDSGRNMFHEQTPVGIACASCHPEGREDGLVWKFDFGVRRTQTVAGGILARAPFHWIGDMNDLPKLMNDVFSVRMAAGEASNSEKLSLGPWLDRIPAPVSAPALDPDAAERGRILFESAALQCVTCHNGAQLTNNQRVNVGTGSLFKVPSLRGIGARSPYMHDGCAKTLADRFGGVCGGGDLHGKTAQLDPAALADLVAYLDTL